MLLEGSVYLAALHQRRASAGHDGDEHLVILPMARTYLSNDLSYGLLSLTIFTHAAGFEYVKVILLQHGFSTIYLLQSGLVLPVNAHSAGTLQLRLQGREEVANLISLIEPFSYLSCGLAHAGTLTS